MDGEALAKKQLRWIQVLTVAVLALLCVALVLTVSLLQAARSARELMGQVGVLVERMDALTSELDAQELNDCLEALETAAEELKGVDWSKLGTTANDTLEQAQLSLREMSEAMEKMDYEALNRAIANLQTVIEPLARFTSRFS